MSLILVIGGSRSGKSRYAQDLALFYGGDDVLYIATADIIDDEMKSRVEKHRAARPPCWEIWEPAPLDIYSEVTKFRHKAILMDCITLWLSRIFFSSGKDIDAMSEARWGEFQSVVIDDAERLVLSLKKLHSTVIVVSGEMGMGIISESRISRRFRDVHGLVNQTLSSHSDAAWLLVAGLPLKLK